LFVLVGIIGIKQISLADLAVMDAAKDGWIAVIAGGIFPLFSLWLFTGALRYLPVDSFIEMNRYLFHRFLGPVISCLFIVYVMVLESLILRIASLVSHTFLLPNTPLGVIIAIFLASAVYLVRMGGTVVGRVNELLSYVIAVIFCMVVLIAVFGGDYTNLLPVGASGPEAIAKATLKMAWTYCGMESLMVFYWLTTRKDEVTKAGLMAIVISCLIYVTVIVAAIMIFNTEFLIKTTWSLVGIFKTVQLPVLERIDFFFLLMFVGLVIRPIGTLFLLAIIPLEEMLKNRLKGYTSIIPYVIATVIFGLTQLMTNSLDIQRWVKMLFPFTLMAQIGYPLLIFIFARLRGKRVITNA